MKYEIGTRFAILKDMACKVISYEKTLSDDADDHYEIEMEDGLRNPVKLWTKQSYLDKMKQLETI